MPYDERVSEPGGKSTMPSFIKRIVVVGMRNDDRERLAAHAVREHFDSLRQVEVELAVAHEKTKWDWVKDEGTRRVWCLCQALAPQRPPDFLFETAFLDVYDFPSATELIAFATVVIFPERFGVASGPQPIGVVHTNGRAYQGQAGLLVDATKFLPSRSGPFDPFAMATHNRFNRGYYFAQAAKSAFAQIPNL